MAKQNKISEQKEKIKTMRIFKQLNLTLLLSFVAMFIFSDGVAQSGSQTFSTAGTFANGFTVPAGVTSITVQVWGAGGGGGTDQTNNNGGPGGGGGAYASSVITVSPGTPYNIVVGAGGIGGINNGAAATAGGQSSFGSLVIALGGGFSITSTAGQGGQASGSTGDIKYSGSNGGNGNTVVGSGGGGGGASGNSGNIVAPGVNGATGGTGGAGGNGPDGDGGNGGNDAGTGATGPQPGTAPGGGGGGRGDNDGNSAAGATGRVIITWTCPAATISYTSSSLCTSVTSAPVTITGTTGGAFSTAPATGLSITGSGEINPSASTAGSYVVHYKIAAITGCTAVDASANVAINQAPVSTVSGQTNITCNSAADGTITVKATSGTSPYTFSINGGPYLPASSGDTHVFANLLPNTPYQIKVQDANSCTSK